MKRQIYLLVILQSFITSTFASHLRDPYYADCVKISLLQGQSESSVDLIIALSNIKHADALGTNIGDYLKRTGLLGSGQHSVTRAALQNVFAQQFKQQMSDHRSSEKSASKVLKHLMSLYDSDNLRTDFLSKWMNEILRLEGHYVKTEGQIAAFRNFRNLWSNGDEKFKIQILNILDKELAKQTAKYFKAVEEHSDGVFNYLAAPGSGFWPWDSRFIPLTEEQREKIGVFDIIAIRTMIAFGSAAVYVTVKGGQYINADFLKGFLVPEGIGLGCLALFEVIFSANYWINGVWPSLQHYYLKSLMHDALKGLGILRSEAPSEIELRSQPWRKVRPTSKPKSQITQHLAKTPTTSVQSLYDLENAFNELKTKSRFFNVHDISELKRPSQLNLDSLINLKEHLAWEQRNDLLIQCAKWVEENPVVQGIDIPTWSKGIEQVVDSLDKFYKSFFIGAKELKKNASNANTLFKTLVKLRAQTEEYAQEIQEVYRSTPNVAQAEHLEVVLEQVQYLNQVLKAIPFEELISTNEDFLTRAVDASGIEGIISIADLKKETKAGSSISNHPLFESYLRFRGYGGALGFRGGVYARKAEPSSAEAENLRLWLKDYLFDLIRAHDTHVE